MNNCKLTTKFKCKCIKVTCFNFLTIDFIAISDFLTHNKQSLTHLQKPKWELKKAWQLWIESLIINGKECTAPNARIWQNSLPRTLVVNPIKQGAQNPKYSQSVSTNCDLIHTTKRKYKKNTIWFYMLIRIIQTPLITQSNQHIKEW